MKQVPEVMRAVVLEGPRRAALREVAAPRPEPRQVLIRVEGCGVCGSNLPVWQGRPWFSYPLPPGSPGHEGWGRIVALGSSVRGWEIGQRVTFLGDRSFAELTVASESELCLVPSALDGQDIPGEAFGCLMNILRRADIRSGATVAVIGLGYVGMGLASLAALAGASVTAVSRRRWALDEVQRWGVANVVLSEDLESTVATVVQGSGADGCEVVIETGGVQDTLTLASRLVATGGRLVVAGFHQDGPRSVDMLTWNWRGIDVINAHERDPSVYVRGMHAAMDVLASGHLDASRLVTHRFGLDDAARAFAALEERPAGFVKGVVAP